MSLSDATQPTQTPPSPTRGRERRSFPSSPNTNTTPPPRGRRPSPSGPSGPVPAFIGARLRAPSPIPPPQDFGRTMMNDQRKYHDSCLSVKDVPFGGEFISREAEVLWKEAQALAVDADNLGRKAFRNRKWMRGKVTEGERRRLEREAEGWESEQRELGGRVRVLEEGALGVEGEARRETEGK